MKPMAKNQKKAVLLGIAFDHTDRHVRITTGKNFRLCGGSEETHAEMTEKAIKMNEYLDKRGKSLEELSREAFAELADKVGIKPLLTDLPRRNR